MKVRVYLTNLSKYNNGELYGKWVELPKFPHELQEDINNVLGDDEEYFISDFESPFEIHEYANVFSLNDKLLEINLLNNSEKKALETLFELEEYRSLDAALELLKSQNFIIYYECEDMEDVVRCLIDLTGDIRYAIPKKYFDLEDDDEVYMLTTDELEKRFNIKQYIKDIKIENHYEKVNHNTFVQLL